MKFFCENPMCGKEIVTVEDGLAHFDANLCAACAEDQRAALEEAGLDGSARYSQEEMILAESL